jgi:hypothetical protein
MGSLEATLQAPRAQWRVEGRPRAGAGNVLGVASRSGASHPMATEGFTGMNSNIVDEQDLREAASKMHEYVSQLGMVRPQLT